ncbi:MAG: histidine phosphatase family protein [Acidimicrobiia bacterium]
MEIILVRHGEPEWVKNGRTVHDPGLTALGTAQARAVASRLATLDGIDEILSSPAKRAQETAEPLERTISKTALTIADLTEIRIPFDDTPSQVVEQAFRDARDRPLDEWWDGLAGGESFRDFHVRITEAFEALLRQRGVRRLPQQHLWHDDGSHHRIVVFAHGGTNAVILGHLLGLDPTPWEWERFVSNHGAIIRLRTTPLAGEHVMSLWEANGVSHLSQEYLTK